MKQAVNSAGAEHTEETTHIDDLESALGFTTHCTDIVIATPQMEFVFWMDRSSCCGCRNSETDSCLKHFLRLELGADGCTAEGLEESEGLGAGHSCLLNQSITIQITAEKTVVFLRQAGK